MFRSTRRSLLVACIAVPMALGITSTTRAAVPSLDHVIVVIMENKNVEQVSSAPYIASLVAGGASFSDYRAITHPSQPNYLALWSGSTFGVADNGCLREPLAAENLGHLAEQAGIRWRAYSENLPAAGSPDCKADGALYTRKHEPWTNFANLDHRNERPYSDLAADLAAGTLPRLAFVIPNNVNNMHDHSIPQGDLWLSRNLPAMLDAIGPRGIVVLTWDENDHGSDNRILTVIRGAPVKPGFVSSRSVNHYTLLRTLCDALNLPAPGAAAQQSPISDIWSDASTSAVAVPAASADGVPAATH